MTKAGGSIQNVVSSGGNQLLKMQIDKSKITDTGTEAGKQGITSVRHLSNAGKAVKNTTQTAAKIASMKRVKQNAKRAAEAAKITAHIAVETAKGIVGALSNPVVQTLLIVIFLLVVTTQLLAGISTVSVTTVTSLFSWLIPKEDDSGRDEMDVLNGYIVRAEIVFERKHKP